MRTSEEIYHRVRWDPRFDPARFTLGVLVRGAPPKRVPLPSFVPGGDIPWHRVLFVEADGEVVWDRADGVDRLDETQAGRGKAGHLRSPFFSSRPVFGTATAIPTTRLRVLTWNTLWDRYDSDLIYTAKRRPQLVEELRRSDADVIALQEVEAPLYEMLTLDGYAVSPNDHGVVLLSRLPVLEAGHHALSAHKGVTAMVVETAAGPVAVLATHLTSDHHPQGPARRVDELAQLAVGLASIDCPAVLLGDFNGAAVDQLGLTDAWTAVHDDETPTFDPPRNPLAAISSLTGRSARLDRVLARDARPVHAELLGVEPPVSDHYGVAATLDLADAPLYVPPTAAEPADDVVRRVTAALSADAVHVVGSRRMRCALAGADLDLVAVVPDASRVELPEEATRVRSVVGARVPGLRFQLDGLSVDLTLVTPGQPNADVALSAVTDADAVLAAVDHDAFAALARTVKAWARVRGLDSAPHGGLPGIAWAILAARTVRDGGEFFAQWAAWDWREPVTLLGDKASATGDAMTILTPSAPVRSCTEQVTAGMRDRITAELYASWETLAAGGDPLPARPQRHAAWAILTTEDDGRMRGKVRALLGMLPPDAHAWPRPVEPGRYTIGLGANPPSAAELAQITGQWVVPGVRVEWTEKAPALSA